MKSQKLYLMTTKIGDYYVMADNATDGQIALEKALDSADYGFSRNRKVINIAFVGEQIVIDNKGRHGFWRDGANLLIVKAENL